MVDRRTTRPLAVCLVLVPVLVLAFALVPATALEEPRDQPADTDPPVVVYVGEEDLDISAVRLSGGGRFGTERVRLFGVGGEAAGVPLTIDDPTAADFDDVPVGGYDAVADDDRIIDVSVNRPRVTDLELRSERRVDVTNGTVDDLERLTVTAEYNFDEADRLDVTVEEPGGVDITDEASSDPRITASGGAVVLDISRAEPGTYRIVVEGSELDDASRTATVTVGERRTGEPPATATATATSAATTTATPTPTATATETPTPTATPTLSPTTTPTATATSSPTATRTPTTGAGAGFESGVAVVALCAVAFRLAHRSGT
jgi:hypothetical protein